MGKSLAGSLELMICWVMILSKLGKTRQTIHVEVAKPKHFGEFERCHLGERQFAFQSLVSGQTLVVLGVALFCFSWI